VAGPRARQGAAPALHGWRWRELGTREALLIAFFAGFLVAARASFRWHLGITGHSMFPLALLLVVARACVPRPGAATLVGALAGAACALLGMGRGGPAIALQLALPGLLVDAGAGPRARRLSRVGWGAAIGAAAGASTFLPAALVEALAGLPADLVLLHAAVSAAAKTAFGAAGGAAGAALVARLRHHGLLPEPAAGPAPGA
jgi:hypothetical protein